MEQTQQPGQLNTTAYDIKFNATNITLSAATKTALQFLQSKSPTQTISLKTAETVTKSCQFRSIITKM